MPPLYNGIESLTMVIRYLKQLTQEQLKVTIDKEKVLEKISSILEEERDSDKQTLCLFIITIITNHLP